jgi:hypothetical protein
MWVAGAVLALLVADGVDAQRGGRKGRRAPKAEPPPAQVEDDDAAPEANPYEDPPSTEEAQGEAVAPPPDDAPAPAAEATDAFDALFDGPDLGPLREQLAAVMDELVQMRTRMAVLGRQLFQTRVRVRVHNRAGKRQSLARVSVSLDGAPVFQQDGDIGKDARRVFEGFSAPGPHLLTVEVEQRARAAEGFGYTLRDTYRFEVVRGKTTDVLVVLDDKSAMAEDFPDGEEGEYDVRTRVRVATRDLEAR